MGNTIQQDSFLRLHQIIGQPEVTPEQAAKNKKAGLKPTTPRKAIPPIIPVSATSWWNGCRAGGKYPRPYKLGPKITVWKKSEVLALLNEG